MGSGKAEVADSKVYFCTLYFLTQVPLWFLLQESCTRIVYTLLRWEIRWYYSSIFLKSMVFPIRTAQAKTNRQKEHPTWPRDLVQNSPSFKSTKRRPQLQNDPSANQRNPQLPIYCLAPILTSLKGNLSHTPYLPHISVTQYLKQLSTGESSAQRVTQVEGLLSLLPSNILMNTAGPCAACSTYGIPHQRVDPLKKSSAHV